MDIKSIRKKIFIYGSYYIDYGVGESISINQREHKMSEFNEAFTTLIKHAKKTKLKSPLDKAYQLKEEKRIERIFEKELKIMYNHRLDKFVKIDQPLVLISQIQRSGGTLLSQLFDMHPECHVHPHELLISHPYKWHWPDLDLNKPEVWFDKLFDKRYTTKFILEGYSKNPRKDNISRTFPFLLLPKLQKQIFYKCVESSEVKTQRDILNCYMTSYFNSWVDNQNLYGNSKKYIVAFTPRINMFEDSLERFFKDYPDGKLISILREPKNWFSSAHRHSPQAYPLKKAIQLWKDSANAMLNSKKNYGDKVYLVCFEDLVSKPIESIKSLTNYLGINYNEILLTPTFNNFTIKANSSFKTSNYGVIKGPLSRYKNLPQDEQDFIDKEAYSLYEKVRKLC